MALDEFKLNIRVKLAALWTALMFLYIYGDYFKFYIPGEMGKMVAEDTMLNTPLSLFAASVLMTLPPLMIILSVMAKATLARIFNIVFGIFFTAIMVLIAAVSIHPEWAAYAFYAIIESIITIIIVIQAWRWPKDR